MGKIVQTAGRNTLGEFAPEFAHFNDDVLFGENWNNQDIDEKQKFIKRVIGLPGETVTIRDGKVYINDSTEPLRDDFCPETPVGDFGPYEVPEGCYFMLGDNRNVSKDSRYWLNPYVEKDKIIGKAFLRYWPLNKISLIE